MAHYLKLYPIEQWNKILQCIMNKQDAIKKVPYGVCTPSAEHIFRSTRLAIWFILISKNKPWAGIFIEKISNFYHTTKGFSYG